MGFQAAASRASSACKQMMARAALLGLRVWSIGVGRVLETQCFCSIHKSPWIYVGDFILCCEKGAMHLHKTVVLVLALFVGAAFI